MDMRGLDSGYSTEIDLVTRDAWYSLLRHFNDANFYQTWSYGAVRWHDSNLSHIVLKNNGSLAAIAQIRIVKAPLFGRLIAYLRWGPLWRKKNDSDSTENLRQILRAMVNEYAIKRGLYLRVLPCVAECEPLASAVKTIYSEEGFGWNQSRYRTIYIDLSRPLEELKKGLARRWNRALKKAEQQELKIVSGTGDNLYEIYLNLYEEMHRRKRFAEGVNVREHQVMQSDLPDAFKPHIMVCLHADRPLAALMGSLIGDTGLGLLGATGTEGLNMGGFHLLNWRMIEWMHQSGAQCYDFGGYNPDENPGTATFKAGVPGKDVRHIGQYEICTSVPTASMVTAAEAARLYLQKARLFLNNLNKARSE